MSRQRRNRVYLGFCYQSIFGILCDLWSSLLFSCLDMATTYTIDDVETRPNNWKGKTDPGIPILLNARWKTGVEGRLGSVFKKFEEAGFGCYRWDSPAHNIHSSEDQLASFVSFFHGSDAPCKALVMYIDDKDYKYGASSAMMGYMLVNPECKIPIYFVDPSDGTHTNPGSTNTHHPLLKHFIANAGISSGQLQIFNSLENAIMAMQANFGVSHV